ncbi:MSMEG_4193 family putative phosphomutase [Gordonia shandongensis]|uniref:MSMEG_4193 family putative phosphomutase n=1 Tax=Gordonia shandongensis TaxID=376351 RepID=UPI0004223B0E|nr:MSMEG_4193 family putative phosphomutase [Gordonia shandongensis]
MTVILIRHGRSTANTARLLAGRTPGVDLDEHGAVQATGLVDRLDDVLDRIVAVERSPLERCEQTAAPLVAAMAARSGGRVHARVEDDLIEVDYGQWSNRPMGDLVGEPLWRTVQQQPSAARFPGGEGLADVSRRATAAVRRLDGRHGGDDGQGLWVAFSHGDVIKSVLADALGLHLDHFQRIVVDPASISVVHYGSARPSVLTVNNSGRLVLPRGPAQADAAVGGSTGV